LLLLFEDVVLGTIAVGTDFVKLITDFIMKNRIFSLLIGIFLVVIITDMKSGIKEDLKKVNDWWWKRPKKEDD